jgi:hypothetical protein
MVLLRRESPAGGFDIFCERDSLAWRAGFDNRGRFLLCWKFKCRKGVRKLEEIDLAIF